MHMMDKTDQSLLDILQNAFPLSLQPYYDMAQQLDTSENEVLQRITRLKAEGIIRRIGGIIDSRQMGFYSILCAISVPEDRIDEIAEMVNQMNGVTHNYLREHHYNMWFTLTAASQEDITKAITELEESSHLKVISMPARNVYKIKVSFNMRLNNEI